MSTVSIPYSLQTQIVELLISLPHAGNLEARQALLYRAGLDEELQQSINFVGPPGQFFQTLLPILSKYGTLHDGRHAIQAVLEAAQNLTGQEGRAECERLLRELHAALLIPPVSAPAQQTSAPKESLDTQILRVLAEYYQQHPGDPEMNIDDVLIALPQHQLPAIQIQLFALKKKGWVGTDLNPEGNAGLVWIEPKGLRIAEAFRR